MADELELKAAVPDAAALQARLRAAGATRVKAGLMRDRRFDRDGGLAARDEVLRVRSYVLEDGRREARLAWKGPTRVSGDGYKLREEHELALQASAEDATAFLGALGFGVSHAIDRRVEYWDLGGATLRLEWYPRMDVLLEVEGEPAAIERALAATGLPRSAFTAEALVDFVEAYEARTGHRAILAEADLEAHGEGAWGPA